MGDYTKSGVKIGTCGQAYYATKSMLEAIKSDPEAAHYLNPVNGCSFAFPFPEYDGKKVGEISNFHSDQRAEYYIFLKPGNSLHKDIIHHVHPKMGQGINLFFPCPVSAESKHSRNFDKSYETFRITDQAYVGGKLVMMVECIYCEQKQYLDETEMLQAVQSLRDQASDMRKQSEREKRQWPDCTNWETSLKAANNLDTVADRVEAMMQPVNA